MNSPVLVLTVAALGMIAAAAGSLRWLKERVRMGEPGVRVVGLPLIAESGRLATSNSVSLPSEIPGYRSRLDPIPDLELSFLPPDTTFGRRSYHGGDGLPPISASVVLMGSDRTSIHRPEYCMTGVGWQIFSQTVRRIDIPGWPPGGLEVQRFDMTRTLQRDDGTPVTVQGIYVFWFVADGVRTPSHSERQWRMIRDVLSKGSSPRWAYISFFSLSEPGAEEATFARMSRLIAAAVPGIEREPPAAATAAATRSP
ncbi:MAG: exosortase-associated EpsI family protein [Verrucomicrobiota bacterium]